MPISLHSLGFPSTVAKLVVPCAAPSLVKVACSDLKATAATLAQVRNPVTSALAQCNIMDVRGVTKIRSAARLSNLASLVCSTDARVAFIGGMGTFSRGATAQLASITRLEILAGLADVTSALTASSGIACNIPTSPSSSNMMHEGNYLFAPTMLFTNASGFVTPFLDVASFDFVMALPVVAAVGAPVSGETFELTMTPAN